MQDSNVKRIQGEDALGPHHRGLDSAACISNSSEILYPLQIVNISTFFPKLRILIISFCIAAVVEQKPPKQGGVRLREVNFSLIFDSLWE